MNCQVCGRAVGTGQRFCSACGTRIALEAPPIGSAGYRSADDSRSRASRVEQHLRPLGVLWLVYGCFRLVRGIVAILILRSITLLSFGDSGWPFGAAYIANLPAWMNVLLPMIATLTILGTLLSFATGYGLLTRKPWGRTLAIITAALSLIKIPLGMGLGIYTLWALAPAASGRDYDVISRG